MPDPNWPSDAKLLEHLKQNTTEEWHAVSPLGLVAPPKAGQVWCEHAPASRERFDQVMPGIGFVAKAMYEQDRRILRETCFVYKEVQITFWQAQAAGIELSEADIRWAGIAIARKAHRLFRERGYATRLMAASMRIGPTIDGKVHVWHLEKLAGLDGVLTVFPNIFEAFLANYGDRPLEPQIDDPVPDEVLERLLRVPYFAEAYDEHGIAPEDWIHHPALVATANSFVQSMESVEAFAARAVACSS